MSPADIATEYLESRDCHPGYRAAMLSLASKLPELSAKAINAHLRVRSDSVSPVTLANERRQALTLWRWAWEEGRTDAAPRGVMKIKAPPKPVKAWTIAECRALVKGAEKFFGTRLRNGADLGKFLQCWVLLAYETGARYGDVFAWKRGNISGCAVGWVTSKTGVPCTRILSDKAISLVNEMLEASPNGTILGWVCCRRQSFRLMRRLIEGCVPGGSGRWLRRSAATHLEMNQPGKAQWFLAHRTAGLAARHYLDQSQLVSDSLRPPSLY
jgi:integrase